MTDAEIIKALEYCTTKGAKCSDCPAFKKVDRSDCKKYFKGAIDLINRQQAEIDELKHERKVLIEDIHCSAEKINEQLEEIEKLERTISYLEGVCESTPDKVRADAIKEFANRLKAVITINNTNDGYLDYAVDYNCLMEDIDDLEKEMVGEE